MTFMDTIQAILAHQEEIPGLPSDRLVTIDADGTLLQYQEIRKLTLQILRIQTLMIDEMELTSVGPQAIKDEGSRRLFFLQWCIVELVREQHGIECDQFGVVYLVNSRMQLVRVLGRIDFVEKTNNKK